MEYSSLYDLISYLQYGTHLHIGVLFFGDYGNEKCILPHKQTIHAGKICDEFKSHEDGYRRCFKCRNLAVKKALTTKKPFSGFCINGVFEYTRPVVIENDVACIIYIGNILSENSEKLKSRLPEKLHLLDTLEKNFGLDDCEKVGGLLETYIRTLLENIPSCNKNKFNPLIENIKNYIEANLEFDIKISQIAEAFHYNERYLGRLFKKETNMSFSDYISSKRLIKSKSLLKNTDFTVLDISSKLGFNNVTYFNRLFKKTFKITPTEYRKKTTDDIF